MRLRSLGISHITLSPSINSQGGSCKRAALHGELADPQRKVYCLGFFSVYAL